MQIKLSRQELTDRGLCVHVFETTKDSVNIECTLFGASNENIFDTDAIRELRERFGVNTDQMNGILAKAEETVDRGIIQHVIFQES